jgi:hypothetical protein
MKSPLTQTQAWVPAKTLNARQVSLLLGFDPSKTDPELLPQASEEGVWTPEQIRQAVDESEVMEYDGSQEELELQDYLTVNQVAALHSPPITSKTWDSYVRRTRKRIEQNLLSSNPAPLPAVHYSGHPLWHPAQIRDYLRNRTGPGNHISGAARTAYRGGRVPTRR